MLERSVVILFDREEETFTEAVAVPFKARDVVQVDIRRLIVEGEEGVGLLTIDRKVLERRLQLREPDTITIISKIKIE